MQPPQRASKRPFHACLWVRFQNAGTPARFGHPQRTLDGSRRRQTSAQPRIVVGYLHPLRGAGALIRCSVTERPGSSQSQETHLDLAVGFQKNVGMKEIGMHTRILSLTSTFPPELRRYYVEVLAGRLVLKLGEDDRDKGAKAKALQNERLWT